MRENWCCFSIFHFCWVVHYFCAGTEFFSDQGWHLCNEAMDDVAYSIRVHHSFSNVFVLWWDGIIGAVCRSVLCGLHAMSIYMRVFEIDWLSVVPAIQSVIKKCSSYRLGGRAQITVRTEMKIGKPLSAAFTITQYLGVSSINDDKTMQMLNIKNFLEPLDTLHKTVEV